MVRPFVGWFVGWLVGNGTARATTPRTSWMKSEEIFRKIRFLPVRSGGGHRDVLIRAGWDGMEWDGMIAAGEAAKASRYDEISYSFRSILSTIFSWGILFMRRIHPHHIRNPSRGVLYIGVAFIYDTMETIMR